MLLVCYLSTPSESGARGGTRTPQGVLGKPCGGSDCESAKSLPPPVAPLNSDRLSPELAAIVGAWPNLEPHIRIAILTLIRVENGGAT